MNEHMERHLAIQHRRLKFQVEIKPRENPEIEGEAELSVTHNGTFWTELRLSPEERMQVVSALLLYNGNKLVRKTVR